MSKEVNKTKVPFGEKISYLITNIGNIPLMLLLSSFFLIFYTDVVGLDAGKLATLFLISKIVDGISDPIMGYFLDRFPVTKMGKFRPMLILGTIICVINYILLWFGAVWSPVGKYVIVYITYLLLGWTFDVMDISLNSLLPVMTDVPKERNTLSMIKMIGYVLGGMVISIVGPVIVASGTLQSYYILIFGSMAITLLFSIFGVLGVKERVSFKGNEEERYGIKDLFRFLGFKPIIVAFLASLLLGVATQMRSGANTYFFTYVMGDLKLMSGVSGIAVVGTVVGIITAPILANKIGKKWVFVIGLIITALGFGISWINPTSMTVLYAASIIISLGNMLALTLSYGIQADNTTYVQYRTGKRAEAAIASLSSFIAKVGQGIAGALPGYILALTGYVANAAVQPDAVNKGIIASIAGIPFVLCVIGVLVFIFGYKLTQKDVEEMSEEIREKTGMVIEAEDPAEAVEEAVENVKEKAKDTAEDLKEKAEEKTEEVKEKAEELKEKAEEKFEAAKDAAEDKFEAVKEEAEEKAEEVKEKAEELKEKAEESAEAVKDKVEDIIDSVKEKFSE